MSLQENITFQDALEIIEALPENQQEDIVDIIKKRLVERRRETLAYSIKKAREEYIRGEVKRGSVEDLLRDLAE